MGRWLFLFLALTACSEPEEDRSWHECGVDNECGLYTPHCSCGGGTSQAAPFDRIRSMEQEALLEECEPCPPGTTAPTEPEPTPEPTEPQPSGARCVDHICVGVFGNRAPAR